MSNPERHPRGIRVGGAILAVVALTSTLGAALWPLFPNRPLDPAVAALAAPGTRFEVLPLAEGGELAARRIERRDDVYRLLGPDRVRQIEVAKAGGGPYVVRYWLGSDRFGRDMVARLLAGARVSLAVAGGAVLLALGFGVPLGLAAGRARGALGALLLAGIEGAQAFPRFFLVVALAAIIPPSVSSAIWILALTGWMPIARMVRAETRRLATSDFLLAARAAGAGPIRIAFRHVLPNVLAPVTVEGSLAMAGAVASEAALSFLGLGAPPPTASWGNLIAQGRDLLATAPWISVAPGIAVALTVLACNLIAEGLRDRLDPRRSRSTSAPRTELRPLPPGPPLAPMTQ